MFLVNSEPSEQFASFTPDEIWARSYELRAISVSPLGSSRIFSAPNCDNATWSLRTNNKHYEVPLLRGAVDGNLSLVAASVWKEKKKEREKEEDERERERQRERQREREREKWREGEEK